MSSAAAACLDLLQDDLHLLLASLLLLVRDGGSLQVLLAGDDFGQRLVHLHRMADPGDLAVLVDDERGRDAVLPAAFIQFLAIAPRAVLPSGTSSMATR